jgi:hypothetical protein
MTTQTHTLPELDPALDWDVPCEWCDRAAEWVGIMMCCRVDAYMCTPCATNVRVEVSCAFATGRAFCAECGVTLFSPADIRWEPIR